MAGFYKDYQDSSEQHISSAEQFADQASVSATSAQSFANTASSHADAASSSASSALASANTAQDAIDELADLTVRTGDAGTEVSYNSNTGILTVPRGLPANSSTPLALLEALKTVDGSDSNLDADRLDGKDSAHFLNINSTVNGGFFS
jgi:hypothetical protein